MAFGSPLGLENSRRRMGVVSAVARQLKPDDPMIYVQTDASINPGNSGGPLVDARRHAWSGINTLILSQSGGNEGIGFAAPSNIVAHVSRAAAQERPRAPRRDRGATRRRSLRRSPSGLGLAASRGVVLVRRDAGGPAERGRPRARRRRAQRSTAKPMENAASSM